jgi:hypothetical protein
VPRASAQDYVGKLPQPAAPYSKGEPNPRIRRVSWAATCQDLVSTRRPTRTPASVRGCRKRDSPPLLAAAPDGFSRASSATRAYRSAGVAVVHVEVT